MPVTPRQMSLDAKLRHWSSILIDRSATSGADLPALYHPTRDIVVTSFVIESIEIHAVAAGAYTLGLSTDVDAIGTASVLVAGDAAGTITTGTLAQTGSVTTVHGVGIRVPAANKIVAAHTLSANAGTAFLHLWYYLLDFSAATA